MIKHVAQDNKHRFGGIYIWSMEQNIPYRRQALNIFQQNERYSERISNFENLA